MKLNYKYILVGLLTFCTATTFAQEELSLQDCRDKALEYNKEKKVSRLMTEKAKYDVKTYRAKFFPHVEASGNYLFNSKKYSETTPDLKIPTFPAGSSVPNGFVFIPSMGLDFSMNKSYMAGVNITQPLYMGGRIIAAHKMSKIGYEMSFMNQALTNNEVVYQTDLAFWNLLKVQELLKVAISYDKVIENLLQDVNNAYDVGMKSKNDVLKVKVKKNEAKLQIKRAENAIKLSKMNLCHIIGLPLLSDVVITDNSLNETASFFVKEDISLRPEYQLLSKKIELDHQQVRLARGEYLPQFGVKGGWNYTDALKLNNNSLIKGGSFSALFSVSVPLFKWGEGISKVKSMKVQQKMSELQLEDASEKMQLEMTMALNQVDESHLEVELTNESLLSAEENLKTSLEHYEVGLETLSNHLEAQTLWQKSWAEYVEARAQLKLNETNYLKTSGQLYVK